MNRRDIKILMLKKGITITILARETDSHTVAIYKLLNGEFSSQRLQNHITKRFGMPFQKISEAWQKNDEKVTA